MRLLRTTLATLALIGIFPMLASAIILETKAGSRVAGYLVREDDATIVVRRDLDDEAVTQSYAKADLALILRSVDPERLALLKPEEPKGYRNYAEELAEKREDPEARELALRLFQIAAFLDPDDLGRGCLLSMAALADSPEQERQCRALAYLLDPRHDRAVLQPPDAAATRRSDRSRRSFVAALQAYRTRRTDRALDLARMPGVKAHFDDAPGLIPYDEFLRSCRDHPECRQCGPDGREKCPTCHGTGRASGRNAFRNAECPACGGWGTIPCEKCQGEKSTLPISEAEFRTLLRYELIAGTGDGAAVAKGQAAEPVPWSKQLRRSLRPAPMLSIQALTEHDPRRCVYRDGQWVEPPKAGDGS